MEHELGQLPSISPAVEATQSKCEGNEIQRASSTQRLAQVAIKALQSVATASKRRHFFPKEAKRLGGMLDDAKSVLDIGSGKGYFSDALQSEMPDAKIVSTDIGNAHQGETPFVVASGDALPFADQTFEVSTIFYVLHHFDQPESALREARRVSKRIIVQEDAHTNRWQKKWYEMHVRGFQLNSPKSGTSMKTDEEWQELFGEEGLAITEKHRVHKIGYPVARYEYQLEPKVMFEEA